MNNGAPEGSFFGGLAGKAMISVKVCNKLSGSLARGQKWRLGSMVYFEACLERIIQILMAFAILKTILEKARYMLIGKTAIKSRSMTLPLYIFKYQKIGQNIA
jgi:hypothetical protein